jgi:hypothetical protein
VSVVCNANHQTTEAVIANFRVLYISEDLRMIRISGWREKAWRRDELKSVLGEVKVLQGP